MNLFGPPNAYGEVESPTLAEATVRGQAEVAKVESEQPTFVARAKAFVLEYLAKHGASNGEDCTDAAVRAGIRPPDTRAFGAAFQSLSREGKIVKRGYGPRRKGHGTGGSVVWGLT